MRRLLIGDLMAGARAILPAPPPARAALADRLLAEAHAAHLYFKRYGRAHPRWGDGSLMTRALNHGAPDLPPDRAYWQALELLLQRIRLRKPQSRA